MSENKKLKRHKSKSVVELAVAISTANENCEGDNWGDLINLCGDADMLITQYEARIDELESKVTSHEANIVMRAKHVERLQTQLAEAMAEKGAKA
jgi:hypothetical protein